MRGTRRADGVLVMLAGMPNVTAGDLTILTDAFRSAGGQVRAASGQSLHEEVTRLEGDVGARQIIEACGFPIIDIDIGVAAALDVDTPEAVNCQGPRPSAAGESVDDRLLSKSGLSAQRAS
ncbi:hypothetical protein ACCS93_36570 [Rhizobium ruizarguesonis]